MNKTALLSAILVFLTLATSAHASTVAYVLRNPSNPDNNFVQALQENGFTVTLVDDNNAATTNFSKYDLILVGDETFADPSAIPVKQHNSLVASSNYLNTWGYANSAGTIASGNNYLRGKVMLNNSITKGLPALVQLYNSYNINAYFLPKMPDRARDLDNIVGTNNADMTPLVGTIEKGDRLYGGSIAAARGCFFGLTKSAYWSNDAKTLFVRCAKYAAYAFDKDNDGYTEDIDCDDNNPLVNPGRKEVQHNGLDDDCNSSTLDNDFDRDGYCKAGDPIIMSAICPLETNNTGTDCNDNSASIYPGAGEVAYDSIDQNCDGYDLADVDGDGYCKAGYAIKNRALQCPLEAGSAGTDCNDNNASIRPNALDTPYDNVDQNCDGYDLADVDNDGYCKAGYGIQNKALQCRSEAGSVGTDCNDTDAAVNPGTREAAYNGKDDDCNVATKDDDADNDGYCKLGMAIWEKKLCQLETGNIGTDCNDNSVNVNPGHAEIPYNGVDDDCKASTRDDDLDIDGYCKAGVQITNKTLCFGEKGNAGTDCDDKQASINPGLNDTAYNGIDENCDGYDLADADKDGYCKAGYSIQNKNLQCIREPGSTGTDCNDNASLESPGQKEGPYNGIDDDCSAATRDNDLDHDGYCKAGVQIADQTICPMENGSIGTDCNDNDSSIYPGAVEIPCDSVDQDCDTFDFADVDHDGYCQTGYIIRNGALQCPKEPGSLGTDCNDQNPNVNPDVNEVPYNGIDDDCSPSTKDDDLDKDGYCELGKVIWDRNLCQKETGGTGTDCNDANPNINPGVRETYFNGIDDDCNPATVDDDRMPPNATANLRALYRGGKILLKWDKPYGEPVEVYKIYVADNPSGFDFSAPLSNTSLLNWTDDGAAAKKEQYYLVRAQDPAGNEENNTQAVGKFDIALRTGYNLISLPLMLHENSIEAVVGGQPLTEIIRYRNSRFENAINDNGWRSDYGFTSLYNNEGYFVRGAGKLTVTGSVPDGEQNITLYNGLNLVGFTSLKEVNLSEAFDQSGPDCSITELARFSNTYQFATYYPNEDTWFSAEDFAKLVPGEGYWIKARADTTWRHLP
jgi:hypothetical protein